jgi:hypothetical protein
MRGRYNPGAVDIAVPASMDQGESKGVGRRMGGGDTPAGAVPWHRRVTFWRAVAGMAAALALGSLIATVETSSDLVSRSAAFHRRLTLMSRHLAELRMRLRNKDRELLAMRREALARDTLNEILAEPDAALIRLAAASQGSTAAGLVLTSGKARRGVIEVAGLPALGAGQSYALWWTIRKGSPLKAAEFHVGKDGRASLPVTPPPDGAAVAGAFVTAETDPSPDAPTGPIELKSGGPSNPPLQR